MADTEKIIAMTRSELVELVRQILAEIPDVTGYAKKTDIPSSLPANGGNADTLNGMSAETIRSMSKNVESGTSATSSQLADGTYCGIWADVPSYLSDTQGTLIVSNYHTNGAPSPWSHRIFFSPHYNTIWHGFISNYIWYGWKEICTTDSQYHSTGTITGLSNGTAKTVSLPFSPVFVLFHSNGHVVQGGFALSCGTNSFTITPANVSTMGSTAVGYIAFGG